MPALGPDSITLLRWLYISGPSHSVDLNTHLRGRLRNAPVTLSNLTMQGYVTADRSTKPISYTLTTRGMNRLVALAAVPGMPPGSGRRRANEAEWSPTREAKPRHVSTQYSGADLEGCNRPGSMRAFALPSRFGDTLRWRDGRVTDLYGNPLPSST